MYRLRWVLRVVVVLCWAADSSRQQPKNKTSTDISEMSSYVHVPPFQARKPVDTSARTKRLAEGLPRPAAAKGRILRRNFIDEYIFGEMERDGIPHAPLATDEQFFRGVTPGLTGRIATREDLCGFLAGASAPTLPQLLLLKGASPGGTEPDQRVSLRQRASYYSSHDLTSCPSPDRTSP